MTIPYLACMLAVARITDLPPRVLPVLAHIEGGVAGSVVKDSNGTEDLGVMQINSIWIPALAARARLDAGETRRRLIEEPCFNIAAAALILRGYRAEHHGALLPAIGDYHSHSPQLHAAYLELAQKTALRLFTFHSE